METTNRIEMNIKVAEERIETFTGKENLIWGNRKIYVHKRH